MTLVLDVRPYYRLSDVLREDVDAALAGFRAHLAMLRPKLTPPKSDTVSPLPESTELDMSFIPKTDTQKRTHQPREKPKRQAPDHTLANRIGAFIAEHGPVTSADISQRFNLNRQRVSAIIASMQRQKRLFVVGHKRNEYNQTVKVLHTDASFVYVSPSMPAVEAATEEKRLARIPSVAAVDRGRAIIERNFSRDSFALRVFEQLCLRPRSMPELQKFFHCSDSSIKFMLDRMQGLGIVEKVGQERNEIAGRMRALFGVVESDELPITAPRVAPSPETIAAGRELIMRKCLKGGGNTILAFAELCTGGPLTRGDLQKRLGCHRTMIDVALHNLEAFGLVVDMGKSMDSLTGHMSKLWDVKTEVQP